MCIGQVAAHRGPLAGAGKRRREASAGSHSCSLLLPLSTLTWAGGRATDQPRACTLTQCLTRDISAGLAAVAGISIQILQLVAEVPIN